MSRPSRAEKLCSTVPSIEAIRQKGEEFFGSRPCLWQAELDQAILHGAKDVLAVSGTGSGKTLTFWLPLLFRAEGIQVIITPLNILGAQNKAQLAAKGIRAISVDAQINPEIALASGGPFEKLWRDREFVSHIISIYMGLILQGVCGGWRLRNLLVEAVPYLVVSATLPEQVLNDVMKTLKMETEKTISILRSNDRPNVYLSVRKIEHSLKSYKDLECMIPKDWKPGNAVATKENTSRPSRPPHLVQFRHDKKLPRSDDAEFLGAEGPCGMGCTDSFGMGIDIPNISVAGQWRVTCDLNTLWQRFGRVGRGPGTEGVAILFAESKYFDDAKEKAANAAEAKKQARGAKISAAEKAKRKHDISEIDSESRKRARTAETSEDLAASENREQRGRAKKTAEPAVVIMPEMDNLINAATRPFQCYRVPVAAYYQNDRRGNNIFAQFAPPRADMESLAGDQPDRPLPRASRLPKFDMTASDYNLRIKLDDFRRQKMQDILAGLHYGT
ncbi:P-loop containing nucleoside triphosphate hydrolase protein [Cytidiella melzeri]|nr:P-loop containing nucleoside triphosphate hydrolase protein [Cytidiella melzeri]